MGSMKEGEGFIQSDTYKVEFTLTGFSDLTTPSFNSQLHADGCVLPAPRLVENEVNENVHPAVKLAIRLSTNTANLKLYL